jgi:hypothetical protein
VEQLQALIVSLDDRTPKEATVKLLKALSLSFAAASVVAIAGLGPALAAPANWSAHQNVVSSQRYTHLVRTNRAFRDARMRKECGPITDPQLHQQCIASFNRYAPT